MKKRWWASSCSVNSSNCPLFASLACLPWGGLSVNSLLTLCRLVLSRAFGWDEPVGPMAAGRCGGGFCWGDTAMPAAPLGSASKSSVILCSTWHNIANELNKLKGH